MWRGLLLFILLFCYVFAFYIGVSVSLVEGILLFGYSIINRKYFYSIKILSKSVYIRNVFVVWYLIFLLSILFPVIYLTFDFSLAKIIFTQLFHLLAAIPVLSYLLYKQYTFCQVLKMFVWIFVAQTIIQCVVVTTPQLGDMILFFNHYNPDMVVGLGDSIRGKALSAATTYHLSLIYGVGFIIYVKEYLSKKISLYYLCIGVLVFVGIFFAGRTGFVGVGIGLLAFLLSKDIRLGRKIRFIFQLILALILIITCLSLLLPQFYEFLQLYVFPYAFEFIYSLDSSGKMETASTNHLMEMWNRDFNYIEFLVGSGHYTDSDGVYYMNVDPGILRHTLFMGVLGYVTLLIYQLVLLPFWKMQKDVRFYYALIFIYFFVMDFKGVTIGINKFAFSVSLLLSFSYYFLNVKENSYSDCLSIK